MRTQRIAAFAFALALTVPVPAHADARCDIARELIVAFAAPASPRARERAMAPDGSSGTIDPTAFADLGLRPVASLGAGLQFSAPSAVVHSAMLAHPSAIGPADIWLFTASDSATATTALDALERDPRVAWVEHNAIREAALWSYAPSAPLTASASRPNPTSGRPRHAGDGDFPNDPMFRDGRQWGLDNHSEGAPGRDVRALEAWRVSTGANDVLLGLADTGIDEAHPELGGTLSGGDTRIAQGIDLAEGLDVRDLYGHGTPVAGVMAARTNDGAHFDSLGVAGVCGGDGSTNAGCRILPLKITRGASGFASSFDIARAVVHATRLGARAVNLSFAGAAPSRVERLALQEAITHGCVVVAAAGNRGFRDGLLPQYPAAFAADGLCVQVGASDMNDLRAPFSSYGPGLDLLAPGVDVWTTFITYASASGSTRRNYVAASGTSFAAPFVTGGIGLLAAARPELIDVDFQQVLRASASDIGPPGIDRETGCGRLDLAAALALVSREMGVWHDELAADTFEPLDADTLVIGEPGFGGTDRVGRFAGTRRVLASVTFVLPDSFLGPVRVWPRIGGTTTLRGEFRLETIVPWAEVVAAGERRFTLRGYVYQLDTTATPVTTDANEPYLPLPLDQVRFGFTVLGAVARPPVTAAPSPATPTRRQGFASPNPFRATTRITAPGVRAIEIWDVTGRRVRRLEAGGTVGVFTWNGADAAGRSPGPGIYLVRMLPARGATPFKLLKLE